MSSTDVGKSSDKSLSAIQSILRSGSPRVLKAVSVAEQLRQQNDNPMLLFRTVALNHAVLFKDLHAANISKGDRRLSVGTKIYVPFDGNHLEDGGMTVFFSKYTFANAMRDMVDIEDKARQEDLAIDIGILERLNTLPTFAPFLIRDCFEHNGIQADPLYSAVPEDEWRAIQDHIRARFSQILCAVGGRGAENKRQAAMDRLIDKLWDLKDIPSLKSLAVAFGLDPDCCVETFYAWKGILYFVWVFQEVKQQTKDLLAWLDKWESLITVFAPNRRDSPKLAFHKARNAVALLLGRVESTLAEYDDAFEELFISGSSPHRFIKFLGAANEHFQSCGAGISLLQHAHEVWNNLTLPFPDRRSSSDITSQILQSIDDIIPV